MSTTPKKGLPLMEPSQSQPEVVFNAAMDILDNDASEGSSDGGSLEVEATGDSPGVTNVRKLVFSGATVSETADGVALVTIDPSSDGGVAGSARLVARGYVTVTNPNAGGTSIAVTNSHNIASSSITSQGRYHFDFSSVIPAGCVAFFSGRFPDGSDSSIPIIGIDRNAGTDLSTTGVDVAVLGGFSGGDISTTSFDPAWFYFEIRDPSDFA